MAKKTRTRKKKPLERRGCTFNRAEYEDVIEKLDAEADAHPDGVSGVIRDFLVQHYRNAPNPDAGLDAIKAELAELRKLVSAKNQEPHETPDEEPGDAESKGPRVRVFALAEELGVEKKDLVDFCEQLGIKVKGSALASLTGEEAKRVRAAFPIFQKQLAEIRQFGPQLGHVQQTLDTVLAAVQPDLLGMYKLLKRFEGDSGDAPQDPMSVMIRLGEYARAFRDHGLSPGKVVAGKVSNLEREWASVELPGGVFGRLLLADIPNRGNSSDISDFLTEGQTIDVELVRVSFDSPEDIKIKLASDSIPSR